MEYRVFELEEEISHNLNSNWTVEKMAEFCEISKDHFHKLFKKTTKQTPIQFLKEKRLEKTKELLETTKKRISDIMREVGIRDQTHFVRDFKKIYGYTPNEYRQHHHDKIQAEKLKNNKKAVNC
jgi:AraC-like DNA-binding protein